MLRSLVSSLSEKPKYALLGQGAWQRADEQIVLGPVAPGPDQSRLPSRGSKHGRNLGNLLPSPLPHSQKESHPISGHTSLHTAHTRRLGQSFSPVAYRSLARPRGCQPALPLEYLIILCLSFLICKIRMINSFRGPKRK